MRLHTLGLLALLDSVQVLTRLYQISYDLSWMSYDINLWLYILHVCFVSYQVLYLHGLIYVFQ